MTSETEVKKQKPHLIRLFGARRVFVFYVICLVVTVGTMIASIVTSLAPSINTVEKMIEHVLLCVGALILLSIPAVMHRRYDFRIPWFINMTIAFLILAHFVLGEIYRFYDHVMYFDKVLHLSGGLVIAACGFSIVYGFSKGNDGLMRLSPFFAGLFSFCFALALLVIWEIFEYYVDVIGGYNMQRWRDSLAILESNTAAGHIKPKVEYTTAEIEGVTHWLTNTRRGSGLIDTMHDLVIGTVGAAVVSFIGGIWFKKKPEHTKFLITRKKIAPKSNVSQ